MLPLPAPADPSPPSAHAPPAALPAPAGAFSYWSIRAGASPGGSNKGLRLDHALVSKSIADGKAGLAVHDCQLLYEYAPRGDHCPILLSLKPV